MNYLKGIKNESLKKMQGNREVFSPIYKTIVEDYIMNSGGNDPHGDLFFPVNCLALGERTFISLQRIYIYESLERKK